MQNTHCDNSSDIKHVLFEHDYCRNDCMPDIKDSKGNVFGKKLARHFGAVDKWTDRLLMRVITEGDWNKIIDRETAILKVQYPFLPEQQLRGKAYKKFGIPAVMGGVLSRASVIFGGVIPKELLKSHKKNARRRFHSSKMVKLEASLKFEKEAKQQLDTLSNVSPKYKINVINEDPPGIETVENTTNNSVHSDETESLTPDFEFPEKQVQLSIYSKPTQNFGRNSHIWPNSCDNIDIHSAPTQITTPNFQLFDNRAVIDKDILAEISNESEFIPPIVSHIVLPACSQIISPSTMPTQVNVDEDSLYVDLNRNFLPKEVVLSENMTKLKSTFSSPRTSSSSEKSDKEQQISPIFDTVDIDDLSQLPTPGTGHILFSMGTNIPKLRPSSKTPLDTVSFDDDHSVYGKVPEFYTKENLQANFTNKIVHNEPEIIFMKELKRKRTNKRMTDSSEDKENCCATENFSEKKPRAKSFLNVYSKIVLKPSSLDNTSILVSQTRRLNLNDSCDDSESTLSPESAPPEKKKKRLDSCDRVLPKFVIEDCGLTPFYSRDEKKKVQIIDLTEEDDAATSVEIVDENVKNATAESSVVFVDNQEEKSTNKSIASRSTEKMLSVTDNDDVCAKEIAVGSSVDVLVDDQKEESSLKLATEEKRSAIVNADVCDIKANKKSVDGVFVDDEEENSSFKSVTDKKRSEIVKKDVFNCKSTAESSVIILSDDEVRKSSQISYAERSTLTANSIASELLSNCCCEYDQSFPNDNSLYFEQDEDLSCKSSLDSFRVSTVVIQKQINEILTFLETDGEDIKCIQRRSEVI